METIIGLAAAAVLGLVHLEGQRLRFLDVLPRSRWLSAAGGISVAYVFVHLLPELALTSAHTATISDWADEKLVYLVAMVGLIAFYWVERRAASSGDETKRLWEHVISFSIYNLLVGYLMLHREEEGTLSLFLFAFAMIPHFLVNDAGLRAANSELFRHRARWILALAPFAGCLLGAILEVPDLAVRLLLAFLAGGVILNVMKEELPRDRESWFPAFFAGAAGYATLLMFV